MGSWLLSAGHDIQSTERHDISVVATTREPADNSCKKSNIASEKNANRCSGNICNGIYG